MSFLSHSFVSCTFFRNPLPVCFCFADVFRYAWNRLDIISSLLFSTQNRTKDDKWLCSGTNRRICYCLLFFVLSLQNVVFIWHNLLLKLTIFKGNPKADGSKVELWFRIRTELSILLYCKNVFLSFFTDLFAIRGICSHYETKLQMKHVANTFIYTSCHRESASVQAETWLRACRCAWHIVHLRRNTCVSNGSF